MSNDKEFLLQIKIVSEDDGTILDTCEEISQAALDAEANYFKCSVYVIRGEHSGYSAEYEPEAEECEA